MIRKLFTTGVAPLAIAAAALAPTVAGTPAIAQETVPAGKTVLLSIGRGQQINLPVDVSDVFVAEDSIADVAVKSRRQIYVFGKGPGETSVYATNSAGKVIYSANVRVSQNIDSLQQMLDLAMPGSAIRVTTLNGVTLLTGTVANASDMEEAERLVKAFTRDQVTVVSRLKTAQPIQVNLRVRIAEVSRSLAKEINSNLDALRSDDNLSYGIFRGGDFVDRTTTDLLADTARFPRLDASAQFGLPAGSLSLPFDPATGNFVLPGSANQTTYTFNRPEGTNLVALAGRILGFDVAAGFELAERLGLVTTLAEPNLTTISGETAEFLAGGEIPLLVPAAVGTPATYEYKQYGVSLSYTPVVLSDGRISLRVRPEVSDLTSEGAIRISGTEIPALVTRRAETTVELGSGQSFMIAGLLRNNSNSSVSKIPGAGDLPVIGNLFKSNGWRRQETELVIVVTPYLVKPVSDGEIALPTDGFRTPTDLERLLLSKNVGSDGGPRPGPTVKDVPASGPAFGAAAPMPAAAPRQAKKKDGKGDKTASAAPGFSF